MKFSQFSYLLFTMLGLFAFWQPLQAQNNAPSCIPLGNQTISIGSPVSITFQASDIDGDNVALSVNGLPTGATFGQITTGANATSVFAWTPSAADQGTYNLTFTATDDHSANPLSCSQSVAVTVSAAAPTLETICLLNKFAPGGFAMFLGGLPQTNRTDQFDFEGTGGLFEAFSDGTAHVRGTIINHDSADWRWLVDIQLINRRGWTDWSALGRSYKGTTPEALANHPNWDYYEVAPSSTIIGLDRFAGDTLFVVHNPSNMLYGFQYGIGANDKNGELGVSGWFSYTGAYTGSGDVNAISFCRGRIPMMSGLVALEGAYDPNSIFMKTTLSQASLFSLNQPYANTEYAYQGTESITASQAVNYVDWLLLQFRDPSDPSIVVYQKAVLLHKDGHIADADENYLIAVDSSLAGPYYIALCHRNHLDVMTSSFVVPDDNGRYDFDFTASLADLYQQLTNGSPAAKQIEADGPWVMMSGDVTATDAISAADLRKAGLNLNQSGFSAGDVNFSGTINQFDIDMIKANIFKASQVPR